MKDKFHFMLLICLVNTIFITELLIDPTLGTVSVDFEYKAKVGDKYIYIYNLIYDLFSENNSKMRRIEADKDIKYSNITIQKGTEVTYHVKSIKDNYIFGSRTFNQSIVLENEIFNSFIRATTDDLSYWEAVTEDVTTLTLEDKIIAERIFLPFYAINRNNSLLTVRAIHVTKWNWKSGWPTYHYIQYYNSSSIKIYEEELILKNIEEEPKNVVFGISFLVIIIGVLIFSFYYQKKNQ